MPDNDPNGSRLETFHVAGWKGRVEHRWRHLADADPLEWLTQQSPKTVRQRPSATTSRVETDAGVVFVKHMTALKDREPEVADWPGGLRWRLQPSLALRVLRIHRQLERCGLLVAPVLLAARRCDGWRAEELLVTGDVSGPNLHVAVINAPDDQSRNELIRMVGRRVAELH
ncbi:MAG: BUD32 family EKC/KEOPS complex subunit, partial [Planctomycetota bacterium]